MIITVIAYGICSLCSAYKDYNAIFKNGSFLIYSFYYKKKQETEVLLDEITPLVC